MTMRTLLNALYRELKPRNDSDLCNKPCLNPAVLSRIRNKKVTTLSPEFTLRCYDYAGFSIEWTRKLYEEKDE